MSDNPYATPGSGGTAQYGVQINPHYSAYVQQVRVVAILSIVHGALLVLMGLYFVFLAVVMGLFLPGQMQNQANAPPPMWVFWLIYGGLGAVNLIGGIMQIWGGIEANRFRRRVFFMVSLFVGGLSLINCMCTFTAIPLAVYGMIVATNPAVVAAFRMREDGYEIPYIMAYFGYVNTAIGSGPLDINQQGTRANPSASRPVSDAPGSVGESQEKRAPLSWTPKPEPPNDTTGDSSGFNPPRF